MSFIDKYNYGFTDPFTISGVQEINQNLGLVVNADANSGKLQGTVTSGGAPVANATVKLYDLNDLPVAHTNTGGQGQYTLSDVPVGSYSVLAIKDGFLLPTSTPVAIQKNKTSTANISLAADPDAAESAIFGIVSDQASGLPIPNASVTLFQATTPTPTQVGLVFTNTRGQYVLSQLAAATYFATVDANGYVPKQTASIDLTTQNYVGQDVLLATDPLSNTGTVGGFIREQATSQPIAGALVALYSIVGGAETLVAITRTSSSGRYLFGNVTAGTYRVKSTLQITG